MDKRVDKTALDGKRLPREWKEETRIWGQMETLWVANLWVTV